jgi:phage tail sheath protein FI
MAAPGVVVTVSSAPSPTNNPTPTGNAFMVGLAERGPVGVPILCRSLSDYTRLLGNRVPYGLLYDCADVFFREGGSFLYLSRVVGPAAVAATVQLKDRAATPLNTLLVTAKGPGVWGNNLAVTVIAGVTAGTYQLQILLNGVLVETSIPLTTPADAAAWSIMTSQYTVITDQASVTVAPANQPALITAAPLLTGSDDNGNVTDAIRTAGLTFFDADLGPGQVAVPGSTTSVVWTGLLAHAQANNRFALLDAPNTPTATTILALASATQAAAADPSYGGVLAPWDSYPGIPTGTSTPAFPRIVPPSARVAGLMSRNDAINDANVAAAALNGQSNAAVDVTARFSASDRDALNTAGVNVTRVIPGAAGGIQLYGQRTLAIDPTWTDLANVRFRMQLVYEAQQIGQSFEFGQIDGRGQILSAFNGALAASLLRHWERGSLFGVKPSDAFRVNTGPSVNTPLTAQNRQLLAVESVRMSPSAELVNITIVKAPVTQALA